MGEEGVRAWQINDDLQDHSYGARWFTMSIVRFKGQAPSLDPHEYDYVQLVLLDSYHRWDFCNDGTQAFRHRKTGWTFPDHCRQNGGCPEMWHKTRRRNLFISPDSPVWDYICRW